MTTVSGGYVPLARIHSPLAGRRPTLTYRPEPYSIELDRRKPGNECASRLAVTTKRLPVVVREFIASHDSTDRAKNARFARWCVSRVTYASQVSSWLAGADPWYGERGYDAT